jgi:hypothetical protein
VAAHHSASVVKLLSSSASNGEFAGGSPAGCTNLRACGLTRIAEGPDSESGSLGGASPFMPTISRRLASAGTADPGDLKSPSLPGASPGSPTGVWLIGKSRPIRFKIEQPWECKSPHADQFGMSTGRGCRTCLLNSGLPERGVWCESTAFRHSCARSSRRAGDGYFSFVKTLSPPRRFTVIWFFAASNVKTATPSIWNLSSAVASRGTADDAPGG